MQEQTLGRRIQEARKAAGLSQESLGERLGVSRQAVSKWEADASVPDLENLIAMSRIFGVTIGALLGVEPSEQPAQEDPVLYADMVEDAGQPAPMGELTDRELAAVEAIAAKYLEAAQTSQRPRWSRKRKFLTGAVAGGVVLLAGVCLWGGLSTLGARLNEVQAQVNGIQSAVSSQIGSLTGQIRTILEENVGILSNFSVQVTNYDLEAETITLRVFAQAKTWQADTTAVFTALLSDGRQLSADAQGENGTFVAEGWLVPMDQEIALSVAFTTGEVSSTDQLETLYDCLPENFQRTVWARFSDVSRSHDGKQVTMEGLNLSIFPSGNSNIVWPASYPPTPAPVAVDLCLYRNQEQTPVDTVSVPEALELWCEVGSVDMTNFTDYGFTYTLDPGDTMVAALRITDEYGDISWTVMNAYGADQNGVLQELDSHGDWNEYIWQPGNTIPNR